MFPSGHHAGTALCRPLASGRALGTPSRLGCGWATRIARTRCCAASLARPAWGLLVVAVVLIGGLAPGAWASPAGEELGLPPLRNHPPGEYGRSAQNWAIVEDHQGLLYVGNNAGVLVYDGATWRTVATPDDALVRSLDCDAAGRVWVGTFGDFGWLEPDPRGRLVFRSLLPQVPAAQRGFGDVWKVHATRSGVLFQTARSLLRWHAGELTVLPATPPLHMSFWVRGRLYVRQRGVGLLQLDDEGAGLSLVPGGAHFAAERVYFMLPWGDDDILVGTRPGLLYRFDGAGFTPLDPADRALLAEAQLYHGAALPDGGFALATLRRGVLLLDQRARVRRVVDERSGLQDDNVKYVHVDRQGGLWAALDRGLARIELDAPRSRFDERSGLSGMVTDLVRHQGVLHVATSVGVYRLLAGGAASGAARLRSVEGIAAQAWALLSAQEVLLAATGGGAVQIDSLGTHRLDDQPAWSLLRSGARPDQILVGLSAGVTRLQWDPLLLLWAPRGEAIPTPGTVRRMVEDDRGALWLSLSPSGVARVTLQASDPWGSGSVELFPADRAGLPSGLALAHRVAGQTVFATRRGLLRFDAAAHRFVPFGPARGPSAVGERDITTLAEDAQGDLWISAGTTARPELGLARRQPGGGYVWNAKATAGVPLAYSILPEGRQDGAVVWFGGPDGLVRLAHDGQPAGGAGGFGTLVRGAWRLGEAEPLFGGHPPERVVGPWPAAARLRLPPLDASGLRFTFAAPRYDAPGATQYQTLLEGFDERWSALSPQGTREYTNLPQGRYRLRVRARDGAGVLGREGSLTFDVLAPWYRRWWAWLAYVQVLLLAGALLAAFGTRRLRRGNAALRATLRERTRKLREQQLELRRLRAGVPPTGPLPEAPDRRPPKAAGDSD